MHWLDPRDDAPEDRVRVDAWLAVWRAFALAPQRLPAAFRACADPESLLAEHGVAPLAASELRRVRTVLARGHTRLVPIASPLYPPRLRRLADAPPLLAVRGNPALLGTRCVAIVGARAATRYGTEVATGFARDFVRAGWVVVSGLARGVDAAAHRGALDGGGATLAFQACGPDRTYPAANARLASDVIARGALVTELPVGTPPRAPYFPLRNRLISGLSEAVVVVEGRIRSGTLTTARHAAGQGIDVWAVPGPIGRPTSEGPLQLLRDGAGVATRAADVLGALGVDLVESEPVAVPPTDAIARAVWDALGHEPASLEELARRLPHPLAALRAALSRLEIEGDVAPDRDGRFCRGLPASSARGERL